MNNIKSNNNLICLNAQGFLKHKDELESILIRKFKPTVVGFTETHVTDQIENHELQIRGYV